MAEALGTEILSADSRQFYREMTIGTAKPTALELGQIKHHFIDTHSITDKYDAARFGEEALEKVYELFGRYNDVIVCGGSGLYIKALLEVLTIFLKCRMKYGNPLARTTRTRV